VQNPAGKALSKAGGERQAGGELRQAAGTATVTAGGRQNGGRTAVVRC